MKVLSHFRHLLTAVVAGCLFLQTAQLNAQPPEAISGRPFGVAHLSVPLPPETSAAALESGGFQVVEADGRILYPAIAPGRLGEIVTEVLGGDAPQLPTRLNISFLFTGDAPLQLTILGPEPQQITLNPAPPRRPREFDRAINKWWKDYHAVLRQLERNGDYPPIVETYLTSMLSNRLGLRPPLLTRVNESERSELETLAGLMFGVEELRFAVMRETMAGGGGLGQAATIPVPPEVTWQPLALPADVPQVAFEPIATHVPEECFYIRFGSFENYLWFDYLKDDYGGNLSQMVTLRGHDAALDEKTQQQLALKQSELAEVMGPQTISDVALIGRDLYLREGAAIGILFEARNPALLDTNLRNDRNEILREWKDQGATLETFTIGDHEVSYLSTPDNRVRSYYAVDGIYHLVTTSRAIVERFYAAAAGQGSLATSAEFQHARWEMPLEREDTIFAYFSSAFFRSLLSPQYQIELTRRLQSVTDMELVQMAQLAAVSEGQPSESIEDLIAGRFLPPRFGQRGDGGPPIATDNGYFDSQRGLRGTFTPIPDMPVTNITPTEAELYNRAANFLQTQWPQMDPLMVGVKRYALDAERMERVVIDANVSPIAEEKYGWVLSLLGPPTDVKIQSDPNDVLTMQMSLQGGLLRPGIAPHQLFLGIQDLEPAIEPVPDGFLKTLHLLKTTPGYLGAWPQLGLLDMFPFLSPQPDVFGFSQLPLGLWRWQGGGFSVLSFYHDVLAEAATFLEPVPTDNPAQIQIQVSDLSQSRLSGWISAMSHFRAQQTSHGNVQLLNTLSQQLRVAPESTLNLASTLLDTHLVCTLGGEYEYVELPDGSRQWRSTQWTDSGLPPTDTIAPLLEWFRGATVNLTKQGDRMFAHAEVDMLRKKRAAPSVKLPLFNLFGGEKEAPADE